MNDLVVSWIRTIVPVIVGWALTWLANNLGIVDLDADGAIAVATTILIGAYYALARFLEAKFPAAGWLLGTPKAPTYGATGENPPL